MRSYEAFLFQSNRPLLVLGNDGSAIFLNKAAAKILKKRGSIINVREILPLSEGILVYLSSVDGSAEVQSLFIHQLRAPLVAIKWSVELLREGKELSQEKIAELLDNIDFTNDSLISLVNDLLAAARMESGSTEIVKKSVNIKDPISEIVKMLEPAAKKKAQKITLLESCVLTPTLLAPDLFKKTFENLLDNAISYGDPGSEISIIISCEDSGKNYLISVHNWGTPITAEDQQKLFTKFYRSASAQKIKPSGTGLGLYIAKSAAEANSGTIWCDSSLNKGTTFYFTIPRK